MAIASLTMSIVSMNASAYWTSISFGDGATASNATYSDFCKAETDTTLSNTYIKVEITKINSFIIPSGTYVASGVTDHVETTAYELGLNKTTSYHQEKMTFYNYTNITMNA